MSQSPKPHPASILRYVIRHVHQPDPSSPPEEVIVGYSTEHEDALSFAISTASRYDGTIYADVGERDYAFIRSYSPKRAAVTVAT